MKRPRRTNTTAAEVMKALSDPTRWEIVRQIAETDDLPCATLESTLPLSKPTISYHTNILLKAGLITARKAGRNFFYSLNRAALEEVVSEVRALAPLTRQVQQSRGNHSSSSRRRRNGEAVPARQDDVLLTW
ncbi:metalloregulator ArsR/SmtB family transcription factor [Mycobacterium sp. CVI_P3]|uniref:Metalloregulator ArsR/SmtB family transcription factor n=1 Tax=Mycobacterium pinniadriaticum TaxID=2994102 RepID=A0ABT3SMW9_9MYCO|nr:metalloregulator ArsR/SmtB family transcription factor [Mycobacterium pinniadriaticum]MCX2933758.1 metalloregulator ArsR/SmtB family transcription factor [Mycobacterium pinniadriaticum]MCX2940180.1 metalloregulator ArsR/SmtB family transcription factor [Mycobacterium pinniadriaticum]